MNNKKILEKAISKAIKNGYEMKYPIRLLEATNPFTYYAIIFSHGFLKAFFKGESFVTPRGCACHPSNAWQYYGQIMLLEEEPLKYLEKFLFLKVKHIKTKRMDEPTKEELKALRKKYFKKYAKGYKIDKSIASKIINKLKGWYGIK